MFPATVRSVHGGGEHTCLLKKDGSAWCWGRSEFGELGNGKTNPETHTPRKVDFP